MLFQVGEKVVYPNHGVGVIENIGLRAFGRQNEPYYLFRVLSTGLTVLVPASHVGDLGLRRVTRNGEIAKVLDFLANGQCLYLSDWKDRFRINAEKMTRGSLLEIAEVLKCLLLIQRSKPLSFREKKMLDKARHMLVAEISVSRGITESEAVALLQRALAKASLSLPAPL